ncbi:hypothetical protein Tco_0513270 [Tanacetum coccineum]
MELVLVENNENPIKNENSKSDDVDVNKIDDINVNKIDDVDVNEDHVEKVNEILLKVNYNIFDVRVWDGLRSNMRQNWEYFSRLAPSIKNLRTGPVYLNNGKRIFHSLRSTCLNNHDWSYPTTAFFDSANTPMLTGDNFAEWKENILLTSGCMDLDLVLREDAHPKPTESSTPIVKSNYEQWA